MHHYSYNKNSIEDDNNKVSSILLVEASDADVAIGLIKFKSDTLGDTVGISVGSPVGDSDTDNVGIPEGLADCMELGAAVGDVVGDFVLRNSASQETPP